MDGHRSGVGRENGKGKEISFVGKWRRGIRGGAAQSTKATARIIPGGGGRDSAIIKFGAAPVVTSAHFCYTVLISSSCGGGASSGSGKAAHMGKRRAHRGAPGAGGDSEGRGGSTGEGVGEEEGGEGGWEGRCQGSEGAEES